MLIQTTEELEAFCARLSGYDFVTVDTEFIREKTYFPRLCLIQIACVDEAACVDPLAKDIDLAPLTELMLNEKVVKVFHAARQDVEIFYNMTKKIPIPLFDTQIAAMVCGFRDSVSYQELVSKLLKVTLDKSMRFTDWARRPLSKEQVAYALNDVTYLRDVYVKLKETLDKSGRGTWLAEETGVLTNPATYAVRPDDMWKRFKPTSKKPLYLAMLKALAAWREEEAIRADRPRKHILRDEMLLDLAVAMPDSEEEMGKLRSLSAGFARGRLGKALLDVIRKVKKADPATYPAFEEKPELPAYVCPLQKMLRLLLSVQAAKNGVAEKMIASQDELDALAAFENADVPCVKGWRYDVFGKDALALKEGRLAVKYDPEKHRVTFFPA